MKRMIFVTVLVLALSGCAITPVDNTCQKLDDWAADFAETMGMMDPSVGQGGAAVIVDSMTESVQELREIGGATSDPDLKHLVDVAARKLDSFLTDTNRLLDGGTDDGTSTVQAQLALRDISEACE